MCKSPTLNKGRMQEAVNTNKEWSDNYNMRLNENTTTKKLTSFKRDPLQIQPLLVNNKSIELVINFEFLEFRYLIHTLK